MSSYPVGPRVLAAVGALATGFLFTLSQPLVLWQNGCPGAAATLAVASLPLLGFLGLLAAHPASLQRLVGGWTRLDLRDGGHVVAGVLMASTLFFLLGYGGFVSAVATLEEIFGACTAGASVPITGEQILIGVAFNLVLFTLPALLYVSFVHGLGPVASLRRLGFREQGMGRALAWGIAMAVGFILVLALLAAVLQPLIPEEALENEQALQIARSLTWLGALGLAIGSSVGEEVFFRGFLQQRIGILATSVIFAIAHVNYGSVSEVVVVFALSLAMGAIFRMTGNLWAPVAAHFSFNFIQLLAGSYLEGA